MTSTTISGRGCVPTIDLDQKDRRPSAPRYGMVEVFFYIACVIAVTSKNFRERQALFTGTTGLIIRPDAAPSLQ
jgi:hypothetical protein